MEGPLTVHQQQRELTNGGRAGASVPIHGPSHGRSWGRSWTGSWDSGDLSEPQLALSEVETTASCACFLGFP